MNGLTRELMEWIDKDESMKFFVISTGYKEGKDGEPSKDTTHPCTAVPRRSQGCSSRM